MIVVGKTPKLDPAAIPEFYTDSNSAKQGRRLNTRSKTSGLFESRLRWEWIHNNVSVLVNGECQKLYLRVGRWVEVRLKSAAARKGKEGWPVDGE